MKSCIIFTSYIEGIAPAIKENGSAVEGDVSAIEGAGSVFNDTLLELIHSRQDNYIICADGGYHYAKKAGIKPDLLMGDFDSLQGASPSDVENLSSAVENLSSAAEHLFSDVENLSSKMEIRSFPAEKDDTDTGLCVKTAVEMGFEDILIIGGIGGRFDHSIANLQTMANATSHIRRIAMVDGNHYCTVLKNDTQQIKKQGYKYLSLFALSDVCSGVSAAGVKYPLHKHTLTNTFPLGVSNEFVGEVATISVENGLLLVVAARDGTC